MMKTESVQGRQERPFGVFRGPLSLLCVLLLAPNSLFVYAQAPPAEPAPSPPTPRREREPREPEKVS